MSYYMAGDYYLGAQGDPGIPGMALIKRAAGAVAKSPLSKLIPGLGLASTALTIGGAFRGGGPKLPIPFTGRELRPKAFLPGGERLFAQTQCPQGYHLAKKYRDRCVRNRSMNPANARALRRAIRRELGFVALARRTLKGTGITIGRRSFGRKK